MFNAIISRITHLNITFLNQPFLIFGLYKNFRMGTERVETGWRESKRSGSKRARTPNYKTYLKSPNSTCCINA